MSPHPLSATTSPTATVIADSVSVDGSRVVTVEVRHHRFALAEFNTHSHAKNSASTRAIPSAKIIAGLIADCAYPVEFGVNQPGMQAGPPLTGRRQTEAMTVWCRGALNAIQTTLELMTSPSIVADELSCFAALSLAQIGGVSLWDHDLILSDGQAFERILSCRPDVQRFVESVLTAAADADPDTILNVHKQIAGRPLEPYSWHVSVHTAHLHGVGSSWENLFAQRCTPASGKRLAQPEFADAADAARTAIEASTPVLLAPGEWHMPYLRPDDRSTLDVDQLLAVSVGRVARTSYVTQNGLRDVVEDLLLFLRLALARPPHWSPFEHVATPAPSGGTGRIPQWTTLRHHHSRLAGLVDSIWSSVPAEEIERAGLSR